MEHDVHTDRSIDRTHFNFIKIKWDMMSTPTETSTEHILILLKLKRAIRQNWKQQICSHAKNGRKVADAQVLFN